MRTFTKQAEITPSVAADREEYYKTPWGVGRLLLAGGMPLALDLPHASRRAPTDADSPPGEWSRLLERYFAGEAVVFSLDVARFARVYGCTAFETAVLEALAAVPYGRAVSYRDLAVAAGYPNAYRAVGSVMARNRLPVVLPCHRVIRNDGRLGDYGDDPAWKARLLSLEGYVPQGVSRT
jgi:methylated-DNA-[protein]-cysteine S-methyltransferase